MLTEQQIRERIKHRCVEQDSCDLKSVLKLEQRVLGLCEALGADVTKGLSRELLESVGITVVSMSPRWEFA